MIWSFFFGVEAFLNADQKEWMIERGVPSTLAPYWTTGRAAALTKGKIFPTSPSLPAPSRPPPPPLPACQSNAVSLTSVFFGTIHPMTLYTIDFLHVDCIHNTIRTNVSHSCLLPSKKHFVCLFPEAITFGYGSNVESRSPRVSSVLC